MRDAFATTRNAAARNAAARIAATRIAATRIAATRIAATRIAAHAHCGNAHSRLHAFEETRLEMNPDPDPQETAEWHEAFASLVERHGPARARQILDGLADVARRRRIGWRPALATPYFNTIAVENQPIYPGDLAIEERLASWMRWNALAMVARANKTYGELGGHIASYASAADLFETGFNHFFRADPEPAAGADRANHARHGDLVFFQPHSAPGVYVRAFLEGRLTTRDLEHFRQELTAPSRDARGLPSYPHPMLMPDFWQFPTGSMGIGPISSIYHARFMRYLTHRRLIDCGDRRVWGVFGDGEMDEPESMSALTLAAREGLDNLIWVVNCNLQRLDGPVRGNGRIIDELEQLFNGAGWHVIKLVWGSDWDGLFARDRGEALLEIFSQTVDGQMQTFAAKDGRFNRDNFFGQNPALAALAQGMTDEQIDRLKRGGHDPVKIHAAYAAAVDHKGQPTVILAHTKKGYGMGTAGQGRMTTHSQKKLDETDLIAYRNRFDLPLTDSEALALKFLKPADDSPELRYLHERRQALGGYLPRRRADCAPVTRAAAGSATRSSRSRPASSEMTHDAWRSCGCWAGCSRTANWGRGSCRSLPTRRAPSAWPTCSSRSASTRMSVRATSPRTSARC